MATIFSGMQPTGGLHLGNYLGALRQWVTLARDPAHSAIYCVVDAHAITVEYEPKELSERIFDTALTYLAAGVDADKSLIFVQSDVREHTELAWYLACVAPMGELSRMTQFKEKSEQHKQSVGTGLFTYPVLMAADILLYKATLVPVGADQLQHLEFARDTARHFNVRFKTSLFPDPRPHPLTLRIRGVDGNEKMSKSRGNAIGILDTPEQVWKRLKGAFTDPQRVTRDVPGNPDVCNIFTMHTVLTNPDKVKEIDGACRTAQIGCGDCKKLLAESIETELVPIRAKAEALRARPDTVRDVLQTGARKARAIAEATMAEVRETMGIGAPRT